MYYAFSTFEGKLIQSEEITQTAGQEHKITDGKSTIFVDRKLIAESPILALEAYSDYAKESIERIEDNIQLEKLCIEQLRLAMHQAEQLKHIQQS